MLYLAFIKLLAFKSTISSRPMATISCVAISPKKELLNIQKLENQLPYAQLLP